MSSCILKSSKKFLFSSERHYLINSLTAVSNLTINNNRVAKTCIGTASFSSSPYNNSASAFLTSPASISEMPIIAAVIAARHNHHKQQQQQTVLSASGKYFCSSNLFSLSTPQLNSSQHRQQVRSISFSTNTKIYKAKLGGTFNSNLSRVVNNDLEEPFRRYYAKSKDRVKDKKAVVRINEEEISNLIDVEGYKEQLNKLSERMKDDFAKQLSVRNAAGSLELLEVDFEGEKYPIQELAHISRKNPQLVVLHLSSLPDAIKPVLQAIQESGMNVSPQQEETTIYVPLPKITREHRENLARNAKSLCTKYKTAFQTVQNRFINQCRNNQEGISEDLVYSVQKQIMKMANDYIAKAEELTQAKSKEILQQE